MAKEYDPVTFGGKGGGEHFREYYDRDAYDKRMGLDRARYSGKDGSTGGYDVHKKNHDHMYEMDRSTAAATGSWVTNINKHAKKLYEEDGLDYNDMRKYAAGAGIEDIGSKSDVKQIRKYIDSQYTSQEQLEAYVSDIMDRKKKENGTNDPEEKTIEHSQDVKDALERTAGSTATGNSSSIFGKAVNDIADEAATSKSGADDADLSANSFLDKYKMDLKGTFKAKHPVREF